MRICDFYIFHNVGNGTKEDIQKALKQIGKPISGNKRELCERLANAKISSKNDQDITTFFTVSGAAAEEPPVPPPDEQIQIAFEQQDKDKALRLKEEIKRIQEGQDGTRT